MLEAYHKGQPKPKIILKMKDGLQQMWAALPQKRCIKDFRERLEACVSADGEHFEHEM